MAAPTLGAARLPENNLYFFESRVQPMELCSEEIRERKGFVAPHFAEKRFCRKLGRGVKKRIGRAADLMI